MTDSGYINRAFRPEPGRKYWNHMAKHTAGEWLRYELLSSGQYIKTSELDGMGLFQFLRGPLPEYKPGGITTRPKSVTRDPSMTPQPGEHIIHADGRAWMVRDRAYPPPRHRGSAADVEHHWPGCGHE